MDFVGDISFNEITKQYFMLKYKMFVFKKDNVHLGVKH